MSNMDTGITPGKLGFPAALDPRMGDRSIVDLGNNHGHSRDVRLQRARVSRLRHYGTSGHDALYVACWLPWIRLDEGRIPDNAPPDFQKLQSLRSLSTDCEDR